MTTATASIPRATIMAIVAITGLMTPTSNVPLGKLLVQIMNNPADNDS
jgi:hypothetical protein